MVSPINPSPRFGGAIVTRIVHPETNNVGFKVEFASQPQSDLELDEVQFLQGHDTEVAKIYDKRIGEICKEIDRGETLTTETQQRFQDTMRDVVSAPEESEGDNPFRDEFLNAMPDQRELVSQKPVHVANTHWFTQTLGEPN